MRVSGLGGRTLCGCADRPRLRLRGAGRRRVIRRPAAGLLGVASDLRGDICARFDRGCDRADDGGRVAHAHVARQTPCVAELGKGAREGCLAGNLGAAFPAADASQCTIDPGSRRSIRADVVGMVSTALATKLRTMARAGLSLRRALKVVAIWLPLWLGAGRIAVFVPRRR